MNRLLSSLQKLLNQDKDRIVSCHSCGVDMPAELYRCGKCRHWRRSPFIPPLALLLTVMYHIEVFMVGTKGIPTLADRAAGLGIQFGPLLMIGVKAFKLQNQLILLWAVLYILIWIFLSFIWRPHTQKGPALLLIFAALLQTLLGLYLMACLYYAILWLPGK